PHFGDFYPVFEAAVPRPQTPIYPEVSHILQRYLHSALSDPASNIEALAAGAAREIQSAMARVP
ncbi:MAG: ABC transporter substrate-binding protein, partial [Candidatus Zixiibacteriota bacterium]